MTSQQNLSDNDSQVLERIFNPELPYDPQTKELAKDEVPDTDEMKKARQLEIEGIRAAESGDINAAIAKFTEAITVAPKFASSYNNRAQAYQLFGKVDEAFADLEQALVLTEGEGHVASLAFVQRAIIHRVRGRQCESESDFRAAARLGNPFAKAEVVKMNPYAALCGQMLHEMFKKVREGTVEFS